MRGSALASYREATRRIVRAIGAPPAVDGLADLVADVCDGSPAERG